MIKQVAGLEATWTAVSDLCDELTDEQWLIESDCPGWTVHDLVAHMADLESQMLGRERPDHHAPDGLPHVRDDIGTFMEDGVDHRRSWPHHRVLDEFREVTAERLAQLRDLDESQLGETASGLVFGEAPLGRVLATRLFDSWAHEQDIRRAVGVAGHFEGPAAEVARDRIIDSLGYIVGKKMGAPDGTAIVVEVKGPSARIAAVEVRGGRGALVDPPQDPTAKLTMDLETLDLLACGRRPPEALLDRVEIEGDRQLARSLMTELTITP